ncbi:MAG: beta strand repeat-containing protein, partial [Planctomycetia bacterium]
GSLDAAITLANNTPGNDDINFNLTGTSPYTITLAAALPTILNVSTAGTLTINGLGASALTISGSDPTNVNNSTRNFNIFNVTTGGNLTISGVTVSGAQTTGEGGAFKVDDGTLSIFDSIIWGNTARSGGGIYSIYGNVTVNKSTLSGNSAIGNGGGGGEGGGIANFQYSNLNVNNSTLTGNSATNNGGGVYNRNNGGNITVTNSTIASNTANNGGGGIFNQGTFTVSNSTIASNTGTNGGGGILSTGTGTGTVTNSTLSGNNATNGSGGIYNFGTLNIANTIIANSTVINSSSPINDYAGSGSIGTNLNNLVQDGTLNDTTGNSSGSGNIAGDPLLSPLANNGGPTFTMALGATSPAITAGDATVSNAAPIFGLDQRGYLRSTTSPSIGAVEFNGTIPPAPTVTSVSPSTGSGAGGTSITITGTDLAGATSVTIGGTAATNLVVNSPTSIMVTTPAHTAGAVSIEVTTVGGTNTANTLYSYAPTVTSSTNNLAINATTLTITGAGFDTIAANNTVSLSSGTGTVTSATATQLTVTFNTAPTLGTLGAVVTTNGISSGNEVPVANIVEVPTITSISPAAGPTAGGTTITINGLSFINVTGVTIGGIAASSFTVVNGQKITAITPPGTFGAANVLVTDNNGTNSTTANTVFNYTAGAFI